MMKLGAGLRQGLVQVSTGFGGDAEAVEALACKAGLVGSSPAATSIFLSYPAFAGAVGR
jgi:hypothetical protein